MHGKQVAAYLACFVVFLACVTVAYDALFSPSPAAPEDAAAGLASIATPLQSDTSKAAVPLLSVARSSAEVPVTRDPEPEQASGRAAEQRDISEAPFATIGKAEPQSDEPSRSRAVETVTSADRQGREEKAAEGNHTRYQVRTGHRGAYYSYRRRNADENSFFGRARYDNYPRRDSGGFFHADRDRDRKNSGSRQSRGMFGTFMWH
jgi:hypothetical protein